MLQFKDTHIGYYDAKSRKQQLLFKLEELTFKKGEFIAVIGPNGAGKTTFFNTLIGSQQSQGGKISFCDQNWLTIPRHKRVKALSFVPSKFEGVNHLTVYDLIAMGRAPYTNMLNKLTDHDHAVIEEIIDQLNIQHIIHKNTLRISDGERQIAMIGKALAQETDIIILDEPTAFLDYNNRRKVLNILQKIAKKQQKLIFLSSHNLELCFSYCSRVIAIEIEEKKMIDWLAPFDKEGIIQRVF